jgi:hypothetical protein
MEAAIKPRIGQACSLGRAHVANVALTFFYVELVKNGNWQQVEQQTPLSEGVHYVLDTARGQVTLLDDPLWQTMGHWRAADREDTLLYKGRVTAPQRIVATFDAYIPTEVVIGVDKTEVSAENLTITVEGGADVPVAIYSDGSRVGSLVVNGSHVMTVGANVPRGKYSLQPDRSVLDPVWNLPQFSGQGAEVEVVDA